MGSNTCNHMQLAYQRMLPKSCGIVFDRTRYGEHTNTLDHNGDGGGGGGGSGKQALFFFSFFLPTRLAPAQPASQGTVDGSLVDVTNNQDRSP
ncbi:hypothetical protein RRG08_029147 [Elysia crispata]|uniref:Uncharacterized protein n=1 Tax=Elysia crispata TaxID=231223 RepID=A0AAE0Y677_9GAST|nr:hypothetical protein RRG08_029147 [Elysia crispata]